VFSDVVALSDRTHARMNSFLDAAGYSSCIRRNYIRVLNGMAKSHGCHPVRQNSTVRNKITHPYMCINTTHTTYMRYMIGEDMYAIHRHNKKTKRNVTERSATEWQVRNDKGRKGRQEGER
jgi:hypothetical protein